MNSLVLKRTSQVVAWTVAIATAFAFQIPSASAFENLGTFRYQWKSQSGTLSADGMAHEVMANAGDTVPMTLTITNRSTNPKALVMYPKSVIAPEAGMPNAHAVGLGTSHPRDNVPAWIDPSSFAINGNRFTYFDGPTAINPGQDLTLSFNVKVSASAANGTYDLYTEVVREFDGWAQQVTASGAPIGNGDIFWRFKIGGGVSTGPAGSLSAALSAGTPASASIADGAAANFTRVTLTPMGGTVNITSLYVTRDGLSTDTQVENVKLVRASDGVQVGSTAGGFDANHRAQIFFSPALSLTSATDFFIRAGVVDGSTAGNTIRLGVAVNTDVVSNATSVMGAPFWGNAMTIVSLTIGTLQISEFGSITDDTPDVGAMDVKVNEFTLTAGATEDVWIEQISALRTGSAAADDTTNIELWNATANATVSTQATWVNDRATWTFSPALKIAKGDNVRFIIRLDIVDGSGLTVNTDVVDGSDVLVVVRGDLYGYYLTPSVGTWTGTTGQGDSNQTINSGALTVAKAASSAPTGNVAQADSQNIGTLAFDARGEDMRISALHIDLDGTAADAGTEQEDNFRNARVYDANGSIVAGPVDGTSGDTTADRALDFTQTFVAPVGVHNYTLKLRILTGAADAETIIAAITAAGDMTVKGVRTNSTITPTVSGAILNTQTVKAGTLSATTLTQPPARSIVPGMQDLVWGTYTLDATASGEDILVTAAQFDINITDTGADSTPTTFDTVQGVEIWADLTSGTSARGDAYETKISNATNPTSTTADADEDLSITFNQTLTVAKNSFVNIAFVGDVPSTLVTAGNASDTVAISLDTDAGDVTAVAKDTGTGLSVTPSGTASTMTFAASGTVTITVDTTSPLKSILVGGATSQKVGVFRMAANNVENVELDQLVFENALTGADDVTSWSVYSNRDGNGNLVGGTGVLLGTAASASANAFTINVTDGVSSIPANSNALISVYANVSPVDGSGVVNTDDIQVGFHGVGTTAFDLTGRSSGASLGGSNIIINADGDGSSNEGNQDDLDAATHEVMKSKLSISVASTSPSGNLIPGSVTNVAEFSFTADSAADVSFRSAGDELFSVQVDVTANDVDDTGTDEVRLVRKSTGVTLDTDTASFGGDGDINAGATSTQFDYNFSTTALTVAAGTTEVIQVKVDTDDLEDAGDSVRAWIDDTAADVTYGTEGGDNENALGDIVARGDIFANVLVKP